MTKLFEMCKSPVQIATRETTIIAAARIMREGHAGALVVVDGNTTPKKPIGIVTDRDIVVAIVALDLDPGVFLLDDLLNRPLIVAKADQSIREGLAIMQAKGIRRLPLVDKKGGLIGIVALDDLIAEIARDLSQVANVIQREITRELELRPARIRARKAHVRQSANQRTP